MNVVLRTVQGKRVVYDSQLRSITPLPAIPCLRCGVCCTKWQPPVDEDEIATIAQGLGIPLSEFRQKYVQEYPLKPKTYLLHRQNNACVFLQYDDDKAICTIHPFKPAACRNWTPSLARRECQEGLRRRKKNGLLLSLHELNLSSKEVDSFCRSLQNVVSFRLP